MSRSNKARHGTKCTSWKDTVGASRSQVQARATTKQQRSQSERTSAKAELREELADVTPREPPVATLTPVRLKEIEIAAWLRGFASALYTLRRNGERSLVELLAKEHSVTIKDLQNADVFKHEIEALQEVLEKRLEDDECA